jgi:hypothetical protein
MIEVPQEGRPTGLLDPVDILLGIDGNAFNVIGTAVKFLRKAGATPEYIEAYRNEAMSGDYDHLLAATVAYLEVE